MVENNGWNEHKIHVEEELKRLSGWLGAIDGKLGDLRTDLAGFRGRVYGVAAAISVTITVIGIVIRILVE